MKRSNTSKQRRHEERSIIPLEESSSPLPSTSVDSGSILPLQRKKSMQSRQVRETKAINRFIFFVFCLSDLMNCSRLASLFQRSVPLNNTNDMLSSMTRSSHSRASDTSSAYSGSDVMQSSTNGEDCLLLNNHFETSIGPTDDVGLSRCVSVNETDDESEGSSEVC